MQKQLEQLREFHRQVFVKTGNWKQDIAQEFMPDNPTAQLRADLLMEEANELEEALKEGTKADMLKEVCDVLYVLLGIVVTYNLPIEAAFDAVHENNLLKLTNGSIITTDKFIKAKNHPKVDLTNLLAMQAEVEQERAALSFEFIDYTDGFGNKKKHIKG